MDYGADVKQRHGESILNGVGGRVEPFYQFENHLECIIRYEFKPSLSGPAHSLQEDCLFAVKLSVLLPRTGPHPDPVPRQSEIAGHGVRPIAASDDRHLQSAHMQPLSPPKHRFTTPEGVFEYRLILTIETAVDCQGQNFLILWFFFNVFLETILLFFS